MPLRILWDQRRTDTIYTEQQCQSGQNRLSLESLFLESYMMLCFAQPSLLGSVHRCWLCSAFRDQCSHWLTSTLLTRTAHTYTHLQWRFLTPWPLLTAPCVLPSNEKRKLTIMKPEWSVWAINSWNRARVHLSVYVCVCVCKLCLRACVVCVCGWESNKCMSDQADIVPGTCIFNNRELCDCRHRTATVWPAWCDLITLRPDSKAGFTSQVLQNPSAFAFFFFFQLLKGKRML